MNPTNRKWLRSPREREGTLSLADLPPPANNGLDEEQLLVRALREWDEEAFEQLLERYYSPMIRLARVYVRSREEAEEVVQETWLAVLGRIGSFEGRSSLKTWIFRILVNRARTRAKREARMIPFSAMSRALPASSRPGDTTPGGVHDGAMWHGGATSARTPEERVLSGELQEQIQEAIDELPQRQREVITLRDLEGWMPEEVCTALDLTPGNQRVLLHRARMKVRGAIEQYLRPPDAASPAVAMA